MERKIRIVYCWLTAAVVLAAMCDPVSAGEAKKAEDRKPAPKAAEAPKPGAKAAEASKQTAAKPATAKPVAAPAEAKQEETTERRTIGSVIFPDRGNVVRESSAQKILTPEVKETIRKALQYVKSSQQADGSWGDKQFPKSSGVTALCCMSLLAEGSLPRVGYSGKELDNGVAFLLSCAKEDGLIISKNTYEYGPMYDHTWATYVLLMSYGNCPWHTELRGKLSRAIQAILRAQKPDGGWRYTTSPLGASDVSVTASVLNTIKLAKMSGFAVSEDNVERAQKFFERCGVPGQPSDEGTFCYRELGERSYTSTAAAGLLGFYSRGLFGHKFVKPTIERISYSYNRAHVEELTDNTQFRYYYFGCYYVSQVMYQAGDSYWLPWYKKYAESIKLFQAENGSLKDSNGNMVYPTAISALILQAPLGYMPQYLR